MTPFVAFVDMARNATGEREKDRIPLSEGL